MRFLMMMKYNQDIGRYAEAGVMPGPEVIAAMNRFNEQLAAGGVVLAKEGLKPTKDGALISFKDGQAIVTDGPFTELKEIIGGYWIISTDTREQAFRLAKQAPLGPGVWLEVRQIFEMTDFSEQAREISRPVIEQLAEQRANS